MAELYYPFESINTGTVDEPVYDRAITAEMERSFNKLRYTNGVFSSVGSGLAVSANSNMIVTVGAGGAHIEGAMYVNTCLLYTSEIGVDAFGVKTYEEVIVEVENVLVAPVSSSFHPD